MRKKMYLFMNHFKKYLCACFVLLAAAVVWLGFRDTRHNRLVWCDHIPQLYAPLFYNEDSLLRYIDIAFHEDDAEALTIAGTAAYNLRLFDKAAWDSLPAVELEDADMMLLSAASMGYGPAFTVIHYLDQLHLWHHSLPSNEPTYTPSAPDPQDPDYVFMIVK